MNFEHSDKVKKLTPKDPPPLKICLPFLVKIASTVTVDPSKYPIIISPMIHFNQ